MGGGAFEVGRVWGRGECGGPLLLCAHGLVAGRGRSPKKRRRLLKPEIALGRGRRRPAEFLSNLSDMLRKTGRGEKFIQNAAQDRLR